MKSATTFGKDIQAMIAAFDDFSMTTVNATLSMLRFEKAGKRYSGTSHNRRLKRRELQREIAAVERQLAGFFTA